MCNKEFARPSPEFAKTPTITGEAESLVTLLTAFIANFAARWMAGRTSRQAIR